MDVRTYGILLKKTPLANDDMVLEVLTKEWGRVSVFASKLCRSSKKKAEVDFFRLLELGIVQRRGHKKLKDVSTKLVFSSLSKNYGTTHLGFSWLHQLCHILPSEKPLPEDFFEEKTRLFGNFEADYAAHFDAFFRVKLLVFSGVFPRFDTMRGEVFLDTKSGNLTKTNTKETQKIENLTRQVLEFLRRANAEEFFEKKEKLPAENIQQAEKVLQVFEAQLA